MVFHEPPLLYCTAFGQSIHRKKNSAILTKSRGLFRCLRHTESACQLRRPRRPGSSPESGRSLRERNGNQLPYSFLENPTDRGAYQATVHGVTKSRMCLSDRACTQEKWKPVLCIDQTLRGFS